MYKISILEMYNCMMFFFQHSEICPDCEGCILGDANTISFHSDELMKKWLSFVINVQIAILISLLLAFLMSMFDHKNNHDVQILISAKIHKYLKYLILIFFFKVLTKLATLTFSF